MLEKMPALIFFAKNQIRSTLVSLCLVTSRYFLFPPGLGSRPQQTHGHVFQAHEQDVYFSLFTAVGSQEVHGEICCESNRIPQRRKTRKNEKAWEKKGSKHAESTVETCWLDSAQAHYTEYSNWTGWIAPHIPHASPCIPVCNVSMCVYVCANWFIMQFVIRCCSLSVVSLGVSGCLTAWRFRTKAANTQWPRKQQTQLSPKSQSPETTKRSKVKRRDAQGRRSAMTMTLWDNQIIGYPFEIWPSVPMFSQIRTASDHIWCFLITYMNPQSDKTIL